MGDETRKQGEPKKKHPCADCRFCQWCSDERCQVCRGECADGRGCRTRELSFAEQIEAYEKLNQQKRKVTLQCK